ncbi:MAG TPA: dephospho-CoA kinase [Candidatus Eremiobacteraceae bacterium]|nr:dephospho-CoA kinase [Candidatus Eremiobacteraceae bacterium]
MIIGLTGGIGAGKSAVADFFSRKGASIIDTDVIAREVVAPPSRVLDALVAEFGSEILRSDGTLDRAKLAAAVFGDRAREARLNEITHPAIRERTIAAIEAQPSSAIVVVVVPLLLQTGFAAYCDRVVSVVAPAARRVERVTRRDGVSARAVAERMTAQRSDAEYENRADVVIRNDGDLAALERASADAWGQLTALRREDQKAPDASS